MNKNESNLECKVQVNSQTGDLYWQDTAGNHPWDWNRRYPQYYPVIYPVLQNTIVEDKTSRAFKIVQKMIEKGYVKDITIKQFIDMVSEIAQVI